MLEHALVDGEDFELILAVPPASIEEVLASRPPNDCRLTRIGEFVAEPGLWIMDADGVRRSSPRGYEHQ